MLIFLLCILLKPSLYVVWSPAKYWYYIPFAVVAWLADVIIAHTSWCFLAGWPKGKEITISDTLERLCKDNSRKHQLLFIEIALEINKVDPQKSHIKAVLDPVVLARYTELKAK
jgi:hypothetical protein